MQLIKEALDPRDIGFIKYQPLIMQLSGVPMKEFVKPELEKLAMLVVTRDLMKE